MTKCHRQSMHRSWLPRCFNPTLSHWRSCSPFSPNANSRSRQLNNCWTLSWTSLTKSTVVFWMLWRQLAISMCLKSSCPPATEVRVIIAVCTVAFFALFPWCFNQDLFLVSSRFFIYFKRSILPYLDFDERFDHTRVIRQHYVFLVEILDAKHSGLVGELYRAEVLNAEERDTINSELTSFTQNEKLLSMLSRKNNDQFDKFLDALDNTGQRHVRNHISDQRRT